MAEDPFQRVDRARYVDITRSEQVESWAKRLGVTRQELLDAVALVGDRIDEVTEFLVRRAVNR